MVILVDAPVNPPAPPISGLVMDVFECPGWPECPFPGSCPGCTEFDCS